MVNKKIFKYILMFIIILTIISTTVIFSIEKRNKRLLDDSIDKSLVHIQSNEAIVLDFVKVFEIVNEETYNDIKKTVKPLLSGELQDRYFPTEGYTFGDRPTTKVTVKNIKYLLPTSNSNSNYTFKAELTIKSDRVLDLIILVTVKNGKIVKSERI